jgi:hypothetical protein
MTQMMAACFESLINQNVALAATSTTTGPQMSNNLNCLSNLNSLNSLNSLNNLNPLNVLNSPNQVSFIYITHF